MRGKAVKSDWIHIIIIKRDIYCTTIMRENCNLVSAWKKTVYFTQNPPALVEIFPKGVRYMVLMDSSDSNNICDVAVVWI